MRKLFISTEVLPAKQRDLQKKEIGRRAAKQKLWFLFKPSLPEILELVKKKKVEIISVSGFDENFINNLTERLNKSLSTHFEFCKESKCIKKAA